jgi:MOSC domain-containing protein YiiM
MGAQVKHRSRVTADPTQPNLRQVHLIATEVLDELADGGFDVAPGALGENLTTEGLDLLELPVATTLCIGNEVLLSVTGYRNPCGQINGLHEGLMARMRPLDANGDLAPMAGIMTVVVHGGTVRPGDGIEVALPPGPHRRLQRV